MAVSRKQKAKNGRDADRRMKDQARRYNDALILRDKFRELEPIIEEPLRTNLADQIQEALLSAEVESRPSLHQAFLIQIKIIVALSNINDVLVAALNAKAAAPK